MVYRIDELLKKGKLWDKIILEELDKKHIGDIPAKEIIFLSCLGRLVKKKKPFSFNIVVHSISSAGKDHLVSSVLELFPNEDIESFGRVSPKALNYLHDKKKEPNWTYDGKILYLEEIEEDVLNNEVMRVFTAGTTRSAIAKEKEALIFEVEGKPIVLTTTATTTPTEEILNRFVIVKLDESEEQTRRTFDIEEEEYSEEIKEFLKNLKSYEVEIPFKKKISNVFPAKKVRSRRDYQRFLDWIRAVAVFHQDERRGHTTNTIKAELEDYDIARECYMNAFKGVADIPLKPVDKKIVDVLEKAEEPIIVSKILEFIEGYLSKPSLYTHLKNLKNKGIIDEFEDKEAFGFTKNVPVTKYALSEEFKDKNPIKLPNSVDL